MPLLTSLRQWLVTQKEQVLPKSPVATAINYVLNQWEALNRYTTDGDLHIDNNLSERTLKLIGMGRINWLFLGSDKGRAIASLGSMTLSGGALTWTTVHAKDSPRQDGSPFTEEKNHVASHSRLNPLLLR